MRRFGATPWLRRYARFSVLLAVGGGLVMLLLAAAAHDSASIPLLVIGAAWFGMGIFAGRRSRTLAKEVQLEADQITFVFRQERLTMPMADVAEIRRARRDWNRLRWIEFRTRSGQTIRVPPRLEGLVDLVVALRAANPDLVVGTDL